MSEKIYRNRDERLGENCLFTMSGMIECYRANGWDKQRGLVKDWEIVEDILQHDVEEVTITDDIAAYKWAKENQGFEGDYIDWQSLSIDERQQYELGAAGIPTDTESN